MTTPVAERHATDPPAAGHDVIVIGSANLDLVAVAPRHPLPGETLLGSAYDEHPGGKGLNQAVAAARAGARTAFIGAVGDDDAGSRLADVLASDGIDSGALQVVAHVPTGRAIIVVDETGENTIVVVPGANHRVVTPTRLSPAAVVLGQLEIPVAVVTEAFRLARAAGAITVLNPAPASSLDDELVALCDVIVPNEHEVELLGGVEQLLHRGVGTVVVTRGAAGVDVHTETGTHHQPPDRVDPVDTTGAGDAFCGAFAARLAAGEEMTTAVRWGAAAGALAATCRGAVPSLPTADAIAALISSS